MAGFPHSLTAGIFFYPTPPTPSTPAAATLLV